VHVLFKAIHYQDMKTIDDIDEELKEEMPLQLQQQHVEARTK
jgi:hypothetical protein